MNPARRGIESVVMSATRTSRRASRRLARKATPRRAVKQAAKAAGKSAARPAIKLAAGKVNSKLAPPPQVLYRLCKGGWAVIVEKIQNASGTRFVCPFCPLSHRVPGPVRGFRKMRRAQWIKLRRVEE
jgi:hypothetical protein